MTMDSDFRNAERRVFSASFDDGLLDLGLAAFLLMFIGAPLLSDPLGDFWSSMIFLPIWGLIAFVLFRIRKYVTGPRLGSVKFSPERRQRLRVMQVVLIVLNLLFLAAGLFFAFRPGSSPWLVSISFGLVMLVIMGALALFLDLPHLFIYGLIIAAAIPFGEWLYQSHGLSHHGLPVVFSIVASIMVIRGLAKLVTLMRLPIALSGADDN